MEEIAQPIIDYILGLRGTTAYLIVGVLTWAEAPFFLGLVTPGEIAMVVAGVLAWSGQVSLAGMAAAAAAGTLLGNISGYWLGRRWGSRVLGWAPLQRLFGRSLDATRDHLGRRGEWAVVVGQFVSYVRIFVPFLAGTSGMSFRRYFAYAAPTGAIWATAWVSLGFGFGEGWRRLQEVAGPASFLVLALFLLALAIRWMAARIARRPARVRSLFGRALAVPPIPWIRRGSAAAINWLGQRLDPGIARGLSLTLGLLVLLTGAGAVGVVLDQVQGARGIARIDFPVLEWMAATRTETAVAVARRSLLPFRVPGFLVPAGLLVILAWWRVDGRAALRAAVGILGGGLGAYLLDGYALHGVVPRAGFPSTPAVVAAALLVHSTALVGARQPWRWTVTTAAVGLFLACSVALATLVAGWAAPSGIVLGFGLGLAWSTAVELSGRLPRL